MGYKHLSVIDNKILIISCYLCNKNIALTALI